MTEESRVAVSRVGKEHTDQVASLFDAYRRFYKQPADMGGAKDFIRERLSREESVVLLATRGETAEPVGFVQLYPTFSSVSLEKRWILNDLFVSPEARRLGAGKALLEEARALALSTGAGALELKTAVDNHAAQALYESLGWKQEEGFYAYSLRP